MEFVNFLGFGTKNLESGRIFIAPAIYERLDEMTSILAGKDNLTRCSYVWPGYDPSMLNLFYVFVFFWLFGRNHTRFSIESKEVGRLRDRFAGCRGRTGGSDQGLRKDAFFNLLALAIEKNRTTVFKWKQRVQQRQMCACQIQGVHNCFLKKNTFWRETLRASSELRKVTVHTDRLKSISQALPVGSVDSSKPKRCQMVHAYVHCSIGVCYVIHRIKLEWVAAGMVFYHFLSINHEPPCL